MHRLFVYGSLMRGHANHHLMAGARYLGPGLTQPRYTLVDLGPYPGMLAGGMTAVRGEVYEVGDALLPVLDRLEDHPIVYERRGIQLAGGEPVETYLLHPHQRNGAPEIRSGQWPAPGKAELRR